VCVAVVTITPARVSGLRTTSRHDADSKDLQLATNATPTSARRPPRRASCIPRKAGVSVTATIYPNLEQLRTGVSSVEGTTAPSRLGAAELASLHGDPRGLNSRPSACAQTIQLRLGEGLVRIAYGHDRRRAQHSSCRDG
jgi:hypothetical protein